MSQPLDIKGNVTAGNLNTGRQIFHGSVQFTVGAMPTASEDVRKTLEQLVKELKDELEKAAPEQQAEVENIQMSAQDALDEASKPEPDRKRLEIRGKNLMKAAENLLAVAPIAVKIAKTLLMIGA